MVHSKEDVSGAWSWRNRPLMSATVMIALAATVTLSACNARLDSLLKSGGDGADASAADGPPPPREETAAAARDAEAAVAAIEEAPAGEQPAPADLPDHELGGPDETPFPGMPEPFGTAGRVQVRPPVWCKAFNPSDYGERPMWPDADVQVRHITGGKLSEEVIAKLAVASCTRPRDELRQNWVAAGRQYIANSYGLSEADVSRMMAYMVIHPKHRDVIEAEACKKLEYAESDDPRNFDVWAWRRLLTCGDDEARANRVWQLAMRSLSLPSQASRMATVMACTTVGWDSINQIASEEEQGDDKETADRVAAYASCWAVAPVKVDSDVLRGEAEAMGLGLHGAVWAARYAAMFNLWAQAIDGRYGRLARADQDFAALLAAARDGYTRFAKKYEANRELMDLAASYQWRFEDNRSSKKRLAEAFAGCEDELLPALRRHIAGGKPRSAEDVLARATDDIGGPLAEALGACFAIRGQPFLGVAANDAFVKAARPALTARDAARRAIDHELAEIRADREDFQVINRVTLYGNAWLGEVFERLELSHSFPKSGTWTHAWSGEGDYSEPSNVDGQIAKLEKKGDYVRVTFKPTTYKVHGYLCKNTRPLRVNRIRSDGTIEYNQRCRKGPAEKRESKVPPMLVPVAFADGLKKGRMVRIFAASEHVQNDHEVGRGPGGDRVGIPLEIYKDTGKKKLTHVFGFAVR